MAVKILTAQALTQLTPAEQRAAEYLVAGASNAQGARALGISTTTFTAYIGSIGKKLRIVSRAGRPARAHAVLASGQVAPPPAPDRLPDFTEQDLKLLRALAENPETHSIARAAGIAPADVRAMIAELVATAGADNDTHLVGLGHAWKLLGTGPAQPANTARPSSTQYRPARTQSRPVRGAAPTRARSSTRTGRS
ncbi:LuxR C-terminal-related transcriptional regulator [Streptomyces sp. NPDC058861]|uniref:LuxR C-terminal-related transcriptional regulator n=1 Tax=Streptomyces sp. NPDC058861 TaxID=3346653 RepID=UPI0036B6A52B